MQRLEDFRIYYNHTIHPELMRLDRQRRRLLRLIVFSSILLIGVIVFELFLDILVVTLVLMIPISLYISYLFYRVQKFRISFKPKVVNLILDFIDDGLNFGTLHYDPKKAIPIKQFMASGIFGVHPAVYEGEDHISGTYGEFKFEMSELNVKEFSKVRSRLNYVFRGVFLHAKYNHPVKGAMLILPKEFKQYLIRPIKNFIAKGGHDVNKMIKAKKFKEYFLTYILGNQNFNIKEILSVDVQYAIADYRHNTGKSIYLAFKDRDIFIAVTNQKDILEPNLFQSNVSFDLVKEFFEDIHLLLQVVHEFDANH